MSDPVVRPAWHALLAPLPPDVIPERRPVASKEVLAGPYGSAIAGWEQLALDLSAGAFGLRIVLVVLDPAGTLLSAHDGLMLRMDPGGGPPPAWNAPVLIHQDSIGGRFEADGRFSGTRWHSEASVRGPEEDAQWESTRLVPTDDDVAALRLLVADVMHRAPKPPSG